MEKDLNKIGQMLLPAIAYGDAAGVPVETKSFHYIEERYGRIGQLIPTTDNIYFKGEWPAGKTSDDTAMSVDIVEALIESRGFDLAAIADKHVRTYDATPEVTITKNGIKKVKKLGYGSSTSNSLDRIKAGMSPLESGEPGGNGNGVIMKMAALVLWQYTHCLSDKQRYEQYDQLTTMTHDSDVARIATRVHGDVLFNLLLEDRVGSQFGVKARDIALFHEGEFGHSNKDVSNSLFLITDSIPPTFDDICENYESRSEDMSDKEFGKSYGFYVPETLAIAYAAFRSGRGNYEDTVYEAVNIGGDADSTASIAGAMVNFYRRGDIALPKDSDKVHNMDGLYKLSRKFSKRALAN